MIDLELERSILGAMCQYEECLITGITRLKPEHFAERLYSTVFELIKKLYTDGKKVDVVTVGDAGKALFEKSGVSWLMLRDTYISAANFDYLVDKLIKLYQLRTLQTMAEKVIKSIESQGEPDEIRQAIEQEIYNIEDGKKSEITTPKEHAIRMLDTLASRMERKSNGGICTTYADLNRALNGGFEPGQLIIIAAQTGKGKTAFAMNLMRDISIAQKIPALYINTEMNEEQMDVRWMTLLSGVDHYNIATGQLNEQQHNKVMATLDKMHTGGFYSVTEPDLTLHKLISICRRYTAQKKCRIIVVDYIGRMDTLDPKLPEWQVLKVAAKQLKTIAQQLKTTVIMLAQVNEDERLEGSRAMKNECDLYGYLRPLYSEELAQLAEFNYCLSVEKNRSGPTKKIPLKFLDNILTFKGGNGNGLVSEQSEQRQDHTYDGGTVKSGNGFSKRRGQRKMPY